MARIGIPVDPLEYVARAVTLVHPNLQRVNLSKGLEAAILFCKDGLSCELRRTRISWTKSMLALLDERTRAGES